MEYIENGICIWCKKTKPACTFYEKPHTIPKSLGGKNIGFDICDVCNHYFGEPDLLSHPHLAIEPCFKEIFGIIRFLLEFSNPNHKPLNPQKKLSSIYFNFWESKKTIQLKSAFKLNSFFIKAFTRQFKRSLYEIFLQEYHYNTKRGLDKKFNKVRNFARFNKGDLPVNHIKNNGVLLLSNDLSTPALTFEKECLECIDVYGFYEFWIFGHIFFLEVTPRAEITREVYLRNTIKKFNIGGFVNTSLVPINSITEVDFTLRNYLS